MLSPFKDFDSKYRWQVTRDLLPIFSFIEAREDRATVCAEVDSRWIAFVARHRLTEHSEEATLLRQTLAHPLPVLAAVARPPNCCGCVGRKTSRHVAVEWHRPDGIRIARMDADRKAEGRGQAFGYVVPTSAAIGRTPYTMVVLLVKHVACARRTHHVVDAVPDVAIAWRGRVVVVNARVGVREAVAALPSRSAVLGREDAGRRDSNPELFRVARIRHDGVQHQPRSTGIPAAGRGVIRQSLYPSPIFAAVLTGQKVRWFAAGIKRPVRVAQRPDLGECVSKGQRLIGPTDHRCEILIFGRPIVHRSLCKSGDLPTSAAVFAAPDACAVPFATAPRPNGAGLRIANHVIDWPAVTVRTLYGPAPTVIVAANQKCAFGRAN